jgi:hypothetical protein
MELEAAWDRLWEALPAGWRVGQPSFDPGRHGWSVSAVDQRTTGRGRIPRSVTGFGDQPAAALVDLDSRLRGADPDRGTRLEELRRRARLAFVAGAEDWARTTNRRPTTGAELAGILRRYPGKSQGS